jgi:hypothetical protein
VRNALPLSALTLAVAVENKFFLFAFTASLDLAGGAGGDLL